MWYMVHDIQYMVCNMKCIYIYVVYSVQYVVCRTWYIPGPSLVPMFLISGYVLYGIGTWTLWDCSGLNDYLYHGPIFQL